ncbi:MAG: mannose-1-phosphate guanylyltransferase/mannose-6-phosphate isomerase [Alphaproteobacteria bacterium]
MSRIIPVILCGGSGTRLWPLSRKKTPKQFLKLIDDKTLLQKTAERVINILGEEASDLVAITLDDLSMATKEQLNGLDKKISTHVLVEPEARNTSAAVALAIRYVAEKFCEDTFLWILPADHHIGNESELQAALCKARQVAQDDYLVTFGINPTRAETGYGYIQKDLPLKGSYAHSVKKFYEKPKQKVANDFFADGGYLWSSGMHLFKAQAGRDNYLEYSPKTWKTIVEATNDNNIASPAKRFYARNKKEPFEMAVLEKARNVAVVPCDPAWSDIGSWESLWEINSKDEDGNSCKGQVFCEDTKNSMVLAHDRLVTCVGVENIIVIETEDSVLVADKSCGSSLKNLVEALRTEKRGETVSHASTGYDWGQSKNIFKTPQAIVRESKVEKGKSYSHIAKNSVSHILITQGEAIAFINDNAMKLKENEVFAIPVYTRCTINNTGQGDLNFLEIRFTEQKEKFEDVEASHSPFPQNILQETRKDKVA